MPIPQPRKDEKQGDYMGRCMEFMKDEKYKQKQKVAICLNTFSAPKKKAKAEIELDINNQDFLKEENINKNSQTALELDITNTEAYQKTYKGKTRSELKDSDFLFPEDRSFPITTPQDVRDAINNFGRMKKGMSYDTFIKKLYQKAKSKGPAFVAAIPESTKKEHKLS